MSILGLWFVSGMALAVESPMDDEPTPLSGSPLGIGAGVALGVPSGLSVSWRPGDAFSVQGALGWHGQEQRLSTSFDLLVNIVDLESRDLEDARFVAYAGPGFVVRWGYVRNVQLSNWDVGKPMMGFRIPAGVVFLPEEWRVDAYLELAPTFYVIPATEVDLTAVLGARIYFGGPNTHL